MIAIIIGYLIAFFLPPVATYGRTGVSKELLKTLICTFFFPTLVMPCMLYTKTLVWRNLPALFLLILPGSAHACWVLATYQDRLPPLEKSSFSTSTSNPTATSIQMPHLMEPTPQRVASGYQTGELPTTLEAHPVVLNLSPMPVVSTGAVGNAAYSPVDLG